MGSPVEYLPALIGKPSKEVVRSIQTIGFQLHLDSKVSSSSSCDKPKRAGSCTEVALRHYRFLPKFADAARFFLFEDDKRNISDAYASQIFISHEIYHSLIRHLTSSIRPS